MTEKILSIANEQKGSFYLYNLRTVAEKADEVKNAFPGFHILYSIKANPHPAVVKRLAESGIGFDAASINEVRLALAQGGAREAVYYSSPGKTVDDVSSSLDKCFLIADSLSELNLINKFAASISRKITVGVRLNARNDMVIKSSHEVMGGRASKFGVSYEDFSAVDKEDYPYLDIAGIHIYFGSQLLDAALVYNNFHIIAEIALALREKFDIRAVNFGGGFGVPYEKNEQPIDMKHLSALVHEDKAIKALLSASVKLNLELGRYLSAECGYYVTRVLDVKMSYGKKYVIVDGGMNTFYRPIMTKDYHNIIQFRKEGKPEPVTVVGKMCTPIDQYYEDILLYPMEAGDVIAFEKAGAYGRSMSLLAFISHDKPKELTLEEGI